MGINLFVLLLRTLQCSKDQELPRIANAYIFQWTCYSDFITPSPGMFEGGFVGITLSVHLSSPRHLLYLIQLVYTLMGD